MEQRPNIISFSILTEVTCLYQMDNEPVFHCPKTCESPFMKFTTLSKPISVSSFIIINQLYEHITIMATSLLRSTLRSANRWTTGLQKRHPMGSIFREQIRPITTKLNLRNKVQNTTNITPVNSVNAFAAKRSYAEQVSFINTQ